VALLLHQKPKPKWVISTFWFGFSWFCVCFCVASVSVQKTGRAGPAAAVAAPAFVSIHDAAAACAPSETRGLLLLVVVFLGVFVSPRETCLSMRGAAVGTTRTTIVILFLLVVGRVVAVGAHRGARWRDGHVLRGATCHTGQTRGHLAGTVADGTGACAGAVICAPLARRDRHLCIKSGRHLCVKRGRDLCIKRGRGRGSRDRGLGDCRHLIVVGRC
jgi:hypothetical protein